MAVYGRLHSQHLPQQDANTASVYSYFADDKPQTIRDARGAAKHYAYNNLGLIEQISWTVPQNSNIEVPVNVTFAYDSAGNRTSVTDGSGTVTYLYNSLSQVASETRQFNEAVPLSPQSDNKFQIDYTYNLSGQLTSLTDPFGELISYGHDRTGRLKSVVGNRVIENVQIEYVSSAKYRAWGALKQLVRGASSVRYRPNHGFARSFGVCSHPEASPGSSSRYCSFCDWYKSN